MACVQVKKVLLEISLAMLVADTDVVLIDWNHKFQL